MNTYIKSEINVRLRPILKKLIYFRENYNKMKAKVIINIIYVYQTVLSPKPKIAYLKLLIVELLSIRLNLYGKKLKKRTI